MTGSSVSRSNERAAPAGPFDAGLWRVVVNEIFDFEPELTEITERVWDSLVEAPLLPRQPGQPALAPGARPVTGCVQITGAWEGAVTVHCSDALAKLLTAAMFMVGVDETTPEEVADALGELANM